jgi:hypothetical protein
MVCGCGDNLEGRNPGSLWQLGITRMSAKKRYSAVASIIVAVAAAVVYWATRDNEPHGPPPPPASESLTPVEFVCNGQDVLTKTISLRQSETLSVVGKCQYDPKSYVRPERLVFLLYVVDNREIACQSAAMDKKLDGQTVSFSNSSAAPSRKGSYSIRVVAIEPVAGKKETVCEGQLLVE